jgi:hypothetical protein
MPVVAVTGSNGKTTTKELISSILGTQYKVMKNTGNLNNHIGLPLSLTGIHEDDEVIGFATTRLMASLFRKTLEFSVNGSAKVWTGPFNDGLMLGYRAASSNQCGKTLGSGSDEHGLIAGVWSQMEVGLWGAVEFIPDIVTLAGRGQVKINTWHMADCIIRHPEAFCLCDGAKPA